MTAGSSSLKPQDNETRKPHGEPHPESAGEEISHAGARFFGRVGAVILGLILMVVGLGLGVTMVLLPLGIVLGLIGLLLFLAGLFGRAFQNKEFKGS